MAEEHGQIRKEGEGSYSSSFLVSVSLTQCLACSGHGIGLLLLFSSLSLKKKYT